MSSIDIKDFQDFIYETVKKITDSNNDLAVLQQAENDYNEIKMKVNPQEIIDMEGDNTSLDIRFEQILKMGFDRVEERKTELLDTKCPFSNPF